MHKDENLDKAMEIIRDLRKNHPDTWLWLWRLPDGQKLPNGLVWLSGRGWSNLPGCPVTQEQYNYYKQSIDTRIAHFKRTAEFERSLRVEGEREDLGPDARGWDEERLDDLPSNERASRILGK